MITAIDTSVLLDILTDDLVFRERSLAAVRRCRVEGPLVACEVVWSELIAFFPDVPAAVRTLGAIPVAYSPMTEAAAARAGTAWRSYRQTGGPRERLVADFLVGAHALEQADRLLTRDRGFHRVAFDGLTILDPAAS